LLRDPFTLGWHWKSAIFSSLCRSAVFFFTTLPFGLKAATGAMLAEFLYRAFAAGFYGALTQAFRKAEPRWAATIVVMFGVPAFSHTIEFFLHWMRGTPNLNVSILASFLLTIISTAFNLHAMRRGVLVVGGGKSIWGDLRALPEVIITFVCSGFGLMSAPRKEIA
jgi:hypothetical protein